MRAWCTIDSSDRHRHLAGYVARFIIFILQSYWDTNTTFDAKWIVGMRQRSSEGDVRKIPATATIDGERTKNCYLCKCLVMWSAQCRAYVHNAFQLYHFHFLFSINLIAIECRSSFTTSLSFTLIIHRENCRQRWIFKSKIVKFIDAHIFLHIPHESVALYIHELSTALFIFGYYRH